MPVTRMRMRPWLEMMINSNSISGLVWVDKEKNMFSIPWKHAARHGWEVEKDACLFKQWAIHTGKFKSGEASPDPKTWKANFRCAMNSLPDIEEVKNRSVNKGQEAVRVYRMLPVSIKHKDKRIRAKQSKLRRKSSSVKSDDTDHTDSQSPGSTHSCHNNEISSTQENTVDSTENQDGMSIGQSEEGIRPDSTGDLFSPQFQVSPDHSPAYDDSEIIQICRHLEELDSIQNDNEFMQLYLETRGPHSNGSYEGSYSSPEHNWGETSSDEDYQLFTVLGSMDRVRLSSLEDISYRMHNTNMFQ